MTRHAAAADAVGAAPTHYSDLSDALMLSQRLAVRCDVVASWRGTGGAYTTAAKVAARNFRDVAARSDYIVHRALQDAGGMP